ncbi:unnamed protein product [Rotaria sordida]|uniref:Uncharacterized protein n=1 Tax=Rotaria sordida TaxID=392033 RepID=A0A815HGG4_9BILA|nr:unnamed protein product [Rotaria sordida]
MFNPPTLEKFSNILFFIESAIICFAVSTYFLFRRTKTKTTKPTLTPLQELDKEFRNQYMKARDNFWRSKMEHGTVIIANGSSLTHIHNGTRYTTVK